MQCHRKALSAAAVAVFGLLSAVQPCEAGTSVFINEIHYDNAGTDEGEAIEIAGPYGTSIEGWKVVLYNGNGGAVYDTISLSGTFENQSGGFGTLSFKKSGIQNGSPDGLALVDDADTVIQFLCYEGTVNAVDGAAEGMVCTDIAVTESSSTPVGSSLQLGGAGVEYEDFTWEAEATATFGDVNGNQAFEGGGCPSVPKNLWVNEIHYDNDSTDADEAVEIAGTAGIDLSCYSVVLYNGNNGEGYYTETLTGTLPDLGSGYGVVSFPIDGIQNGAPDGIALVLDDTTVVQFLSYEGTLTAVDGPAAGFTSVDIGVDEEPAPAAGLSLQLSGHGNEYSDFSWTEAVTATPDAINAGQTIDDDPAGGPFTILHMNDAHSRLLPHDFDLPSKDDTVGLEKVGGAAYFGAKMLELKAAYPNSLVLDAGDISEGNPLGDLRGNGGMIDFYNLLDSKLKALGGRGIDATVVGNHDVRSLKMLNNLKPVAEGGLAEFPVISVNVCHEGTETPYFEPYTVVTVNGTRVGILGYTNDESSYLGDDTETVVDVVPCSWAGGTGEISIRDWVQTLRDDESCDVVVLLSHIGHSRIVSGSDALLEDDGIVDPPEVAVTGHWHTWTERVWRPGNLNGKTLLTESASYLQFIGELDVTNTGEYIDAMQYPIRNSDILPDLDIQDLVDDLMAEYEAQIPAPEYDLDEIVGYSAEDLVGDKDKWWTVSEYPWNAVNSAGAWITDAMVWGAEQAGYPVQLAMQSGGGIRRDTAAGAITYAAIYETYPWSDDNMLRIQMTGREIFNWIEADHIGTSISDGWLITAHDGQITAMTYDGAAVAMSGSYDVAISEYMFAHPVITLSDTSPEDMGTSIRDKVAAYTAQFDSAENPMYPNGISERYSLNTEFAGGFRAVITMIADNESEPYFEEAFIRFLEATPETLERRTGYGLSELVAADGSINSSHRFSEIMLYRSHLGFPEGALVPGDIIEVWGEGGFYDGTPELIDQEGISADGEEFVRYGYDETLALPEYQPDFESFFDDAHENHYVKVYAEQIGTSTVRDSTGTAMSVYESNGYDLKTLPGSVGEILVLTGTVTQEGGTRLFRCSTAVVASSVPVVGYPPASTVDAVEPSHQAGPMTLSATASDALGTASGAYVTSAADAQVVEGYPTYNYGTSTAMYVQSASGGSYLNERAWVRFDLTGVVPDGATITSATLKLYCWKAGNADMEASVHAADDDSWTETGLVWNNQPGFGEALDTVTLISGRTSVWYAWDVTDAVAEEAAGDAEAAFLIKAAAEGSSFALTYAFDAKEYSSGSVAPVLDIQWEATGGGSHQPVEVSFFYRYAADGLAWGEWTGIGTDTASEDGWTMPFSFPEDTGTYEFYSVAVDEDGNVEDSPIRADAQAIYNHPPDEPSDALIPDGSTDVSVNPTLGVTVGDTDGDTVEVCFYGREAGAEEYALIGCETGVASGTAVSVFWTDLDAGESYEWYVTVDDGVDVTQTDASSFTTAAGAPGVPAMEPYHAAVAVIMMLVLGVFYLHRLTGRRF